MGSFFPVIRMHTQLAKERTLPQPVKCSIYGKTNTYLQYEIQQERGIFKS